MYFDKEMGAREEKSIEEDDSRTYIMLCVV